MDILENFLQPFGLIIVGIIFYIYLLNYSKRPSASRYSKSDWNYFIKKIIASYYVRKFQKSLNIIWLKDDSQTVKILESEDIFDSQSITGSDSNGNIIYLKIRKCGFKTTESSIQIWSSTGNHFSLTHAPVLIKDASDWSGNGLRLKILEKFRKILITFDGNVKFEFDWESVSSPKHYIFQQCKSILVKAIALETWRNGDWLEILTKPSITGYDQYGTMSGEIKYPNSDSIKTVFSGLRSRRYGSLSGSRRYIELSGCLKDGTHFHLGAISFKNGLTDFRYGTVKRLNEDEESISDCDLAMEYMGEAPEGIPHMFAVNFMFKGQVYKNLFYLRHGTKSNSEFLFPMHCSVMKQFGYGLAVFGYNYLQ